MVLASATFYSCAGLLWDYWLLSSVLGCAQPQLSILGFAAGCLVRTNISLHRARANELADREYHGIKKLGPLIAGPICRFTFDQCPNSADHKLRSS